MLITMMTICRPLPAILEGEAILLFICSCSLDDNRAEKVVGMFIEVAALHFYLSKRYFER